MPRRSRFSIVKTHIEDVLNSENKKIFTPRDISNIFTINSLVWRLPQSVGPSDFVEFLINRSKLQKVDLEFPSGTITRYVWNHRISPELIYDICMSLRLNGYFSHYTALFLNDLTEQIPKQIYVTYEQSPKNKSSEKITQEAIDKAFNKPIRQSNNTTTCCSYRITLLNGQFTNKIGVISKVDIQSTSKINMTNLERTLIDITVRPEHSGGVFEVLKAYEAAKENVSINTLKAYLNKINFVYPYHQAIGFYLERAGYSESKLKIIDKLEKNLDFYLLHNIDQVFYSERWKLYYPKFLDE